MFGTPSTPTFGTPSAFGTPSSTPFATPAFGSTTPGFSTPSSASALGTTPSPFGTPQSTPGFGTPSTPAFSFPQTPQQSAFPSFGQTQQQQGSAFGGFGQPQATPPSQFGSNVMQQQITTQMAPVAPISLSLADRDLQTIIDAYKQEPANQKYAFRHLLFSVTDPSARVKPMGASDIMWAEAMGKLEGMESTDRERLWPQLVQGFKDLSVRLKIQDEVMASDEERLRKTQSNVKMLQRHCQTDTLPRTQKLKHKEQTLQRRLLRVMRIVEGLENRGVRMPLTKGEVELSEKISSVVRQLNGPQAELPKRVHNLYSIPRASADVAITYLPTSARIDKQSLADMQDVVQQETEAIAKLANVLKKETRDMEIIMSQGTNMMVEDGVQRQALIHRQAFRRRQALRRR